MRVAGIGWIARNHKMKMIEADPEEEAPFALMAKALRGLRGFKLSLLTQIGGEAGWTVDIQELGKARITKLLTMTDPHISEEIALSATARLSVNDLDLAMQLASQASLGNQEDWKKL